MAKTWTFDFISSINEIARSDWQALAGEDYPFIHYDFLAALENSGAVGGASGWQPRHLRISRAGKLVGLMPLYLKQHSWGEYVFDWAWADAYQRYGFNYYPKLVNAIPFTPATGPRLLLADNQDAELLPSLTAAMEVEIKRIGGSSWHCLFPEESFSRQLASQGASQRLGCQYHWLNQDYQTFDDFLASFNSRKRKNLKRERRRVQEQGLELVRKEGNEVSTEEWRQFYLFYHLTYFKRSGRQGYLNEVFFQTLARTMADKLMLVIARKDNEMVAAALFFKGSDTLYGRYWGCREEFECLHFEACYYQGIEYAIEHKLQRFDPGAQGEHKIQRGFTPIPTWSNHWIARPDFRAAIDDFLERERPEMENYMEEAREWLPFRESD